VQKGAHITSGTSRQLADNAEFKCAAFLQFVGGLEDPRKCLERMTGLRTRNVTT